MNIFIVNRVYELLTQSEPFKEMSRVLESSKLYLMDKQLKKIQVWFYKTDTDIGLDMLSIINKYMTKIV